MRRGVSWGRGGRGGIGEGGGGGERERSREREAMRMFGVCGHLKSERGLEVICYSIFCPIFCFLLFVCLFLATCTACRSF